MLYCFVLCVDHMLVCPVFLVKPVLLVKTCFVNLFLIVIIKELVLSAILVSLIFV